MTSFNPGRLRLAREKAQLSKIELAERIELTPRRIGDFENHAAVPPVATLTRLSEALDVPRGFFAKGSPPSTENISFRSQSRMKAKTRKAAMASSVLAAEFNAWLEGEFTFDDVGLPTDLAGTDPVAAANEFRGRLGLGVAPAPNLIHLAELLGVRVLGIASSSPHLDAFSFWSGPRPYILLNHSGTAERRRWNLAHELAHLVLHRGAHHLPSDRGREDEADRFAAELLLPSEGLRRWGAYASTLSEVVDQKVQWAVSAVSYIRRLRDLGIVTEWTYRSLMIDASSAGYRRAEDAVARETSPALSAVAENLRASSTTFAAVAAAVDFPLRHVEELLHGLAVVALTNADTEHSGSVERPVFQVLQGGRR